MVRKQCLHVAEANLQHSHGSVQEMFHVDGQTEGSKMATSKRESNGPKRGRLAHQNDNVDVIL